VDERCPSCGGELDSSGLCPHCGWDPATAYAAGRKRPLLPILLRILFPEKVNGEYVRFDRPIGRGVGSIWISFSKNLVDWGKAEVVMPPRGGYWDSFRVGASAPPIKTKDGWLEIYHGVKMTSSGPIYKIGTALLDLNDPSKVLARCEEPALSPREDYERVGDVGNVVFACGAVVEENGEIKVYYGGADTYLCVATADFAKLVAFTKSNGEA